MLLVSGFFVVLFCPPSPLYLASKKAMIHSSKIHQIKGEISISFVEESGAEVTGKKVVITSFHSKGRTLNIKFCDSEQIRTVRRCTITHINDQEVYL
jgi:hypothetical protein